MCRERGGLGGNTKKNIIMGHTHTPLIFINYLTSKQWILSRGSTRGVQRVGLSCTHVSLSQLHVQVCLSCGQGSECGKNNSRYDDSSYHTTSNNCASCSLIIQGVTRLTVGGSNSSEICALCLTSCHCCAVACS